MTAQVMSAAQAHVAIRNVPRPIASASTPSVRSVAASANSDASTPSTTVTTPWARFTNPAARTSTPTTVTAVGRRADSCGTEVPASGGGAVVATQAQAYSTSHGCLLTGDRVGSRDVAG